MMLAYPTARQFQNRNGAEVGTVTMLLLTLGSKVNAQEHGYRLPASIYATSSHSAAAACWFPLGNPQT